jgi:N-methylhydantoinase A
MSVTVGIDIGGTFTDTVVMDDRGTVTTYKSPTTPGALIDGFLENVALAAQRAGREVAGFLGSVGYIGHGTTAATNAFIERRGAKVGLVTTRGFEQTIFQQRMMGMTAGLSASEVTDYSRRAIPEPLCPPRRVFGIRERVDYRGRVLTPLQEEDVRRAALRLAEDEVEAVAVCFLWSFKNPVHERRAAEIVAELLPDTYLSVSCDLVPRIGEYERTATTLVNAYLGPLISRYTETLESRLVEEGARARILLLDSSGGVITPAQASRQPVRLLLSGPSGGLTASQYLGLLLEHRNVITFDMGGTSADVGLIVDGVPLQRSETVTGKYHLLLPMADIETIGAGGGSIARAEEGGYLRVGPESAGADPGPVCYGRGGEYPTVTDADLVLGIIDPAHFLGGRLELDRAAAESALDRQVAGPLGISTIEAAAGIKEIVDNRMADLLRTVTVQRGHDPREFVLYAFGGAGPTHAPAFGLELVETILVPVTQSVHSAFGAIASDLHIGFGLSEPMRISRDANVSAEVRERVASIFASLAAQGQAALGEQGVPEDRQTLSPFVEMRYTRQTRELRVPVSDVESEESVGRIIREFEQIYAQRYGQESVPEGVGFEFVTFSVEARGLLARPEFKLFERDGESAAHARIGERGVYDPSAAEFLPTAIFEGSELKPGNRIEGPAVIEYSGTTIAILRGQTATVDAYLNVAIRRTRP